MPDYLAYSMHERHPREGSTLGVALSPERWALLVKHFGPRTERAARFTITTAVEVEGITFMPAVYYPA